MGLKTGHIPLGHFPSGSFPDGHWPHPPVYIVSLDEMKNQLRVDFDDDDRLIAGLMRAATEWAEEFQRRFYISRPAYMYMDRFDGAIRPVYSPLVSVGSIKYVDENGTLQLLADTDYRVDTGTEPGIIEPAWTLSWPATRDITNAVIIEYTAGYGGADDVPDDIKSAVMMMVCHLYENRSAVAGKKVAVPKGVKEMLRKRKLVSL